MRSSHVIDEQATAQIDWKIGDIIAEADEYLQYRKFLGITTKGYYLVQDFFSDNNAKASNCYAITKVDDLMDFGTERSRDGVYIGYAYTGEKHYETNFIDGKEDGLSINWNNDGTKLIECYMKEGKFHGPWKFWYSDNGQLASEGNYENDLKQGLWTEWEEDGQKTAEIWYENDVEIRRVDF